MSLLNLDLTNFRNHRKFKLDFGQTTILTGLNGLGKTNILESIYLLSTTQSYRTPHLKNLVTWQENFAKIKAELLSGDKLELVIDLINNKKKLSFNNIEKKSSDFIGYLPVVLFAPENLIIINGSPKEKRRYFNIILSQVDKNYTQNIIKLHQIITNRNHLLKRIKEKKSQKIELEYWNDQLQLINDYVILKRKELIEIINQSLGNEYQQISQEKNNLCILYQPSADCGKLREILNNNIDKEIFQHTTLYGPHRDEFYFYLDNKNLTNFASRGELRSALLAVKMCELKFIENVSHNKAVMLLDDVFSELDEKRRFKLIEMIYNHQTIITTTQLSSFEKQSFKKALIKELNSDTIA